MKVCWEPGIPSTQLVGGGSSILPRIAAADRIPNGQEVITTTAHAFVKYVSTSSAKGLHVSDWYLSIRTALARFSPIKKNPPSAPAIGETQQRGGNLRLKIWLAGAIY